MSDEWTRSAIAEKLYTEMNQWDENQEPFSEQKKYYTDALRYANRRVIVKKPSDFQDVFHVYMLTFSPELRDHIKRLDEDALNEVISEAVKRIIKSRKPEVYRDYLQFEPIRWDLINGDGNGKGDGSLIAEHVEDTEEEESLTILQKLAKRLMNENHFKTMRDNKDLYWYNGTGKYIPDQQWRIEEFCQINYAKIKTHEVQEVINMIKRYTLVDRQDFDKNTDEINLGDCILNIHTGKTREHSREELFLSQIMIPYDPKAQCPKIVKFLHEALKSTNDYITAIELFGYCLYKTARYEKAVLCAGDGDNGKGTFLKIFERFVGLENASHVSLQDMNSDKFSIADLYGKSVNTFADLPADKLKSTGNFKMLTSGDMIRAQRKHGQPFYFANYAVLMFSANQIPQSDDQTYAFFKRWILLPFEHTFTGPDSNKNLIAELTTKTELSGLLNLALIGLRKLIKDNAFLHVDDIETVQRDYLKDNPIEAFISERCELVTGGEVICRDLYFEYIEFYKKNKGTSAAAVADNVFGMELRLKHVTKRQKRIKGQRESIYVGIKLKENSRLA